MCVCVCVFGIWEQVGHGRCNVGFNSDQQASLSKKEGMEQLAQRRRGKERGRYEGNCDFDTLNSGRH